MKSAIDYYYDSYWDSFYDWESDENGEYICIEEEAADGYWDEWTGEFVETGFYYWDDCNYYYYDMDYECDEWGCWWVYSDETCLTTEFGDYCYDPEEGIDTDDF